MFTLSVSWTKIIGVEAHHDPERRSRNGVTMNQEAHLFRPPEDVRSFDVPVYAAVDEADGIHRPMPKQLCFINEADLRELLSGVDPETAVVDWACRDNPLPEGKLPHLGPWACFVEAAPGRWVSFDDLP